MTAGGSEAEAVGAAASGRTPMRRGAQRARGEPNTTGRLPLATVTERDGSRGDVQRRWRELIADFGDTAELRGLVVAQAAEWTEKKRWPMCGPPSRAAREPSGFGFRQ